MAAMLKRQQFENNENDKKELKVLKHQYIDIHNNKEK